MPLENKGLALIRKYEAQKAEEGHSNFFGGCILALGSLGTLLYVTDVVRNGNTPGGIGLSFQPSWTPGYEINHDGIHQWGEWGYLASYIGATAVGAWAARKVARPMARKLREWSHESSGEKARDAEFNACYQTLAHKLFSGEPLPASLHGDYRDALHLDLLINDLSHNSARSKNFAADLERRQPGLVAPLVREHFEKGDYTRESPTNAYLGLLQMEDLLHLGDHYVESGRLEPAEKFIHDHDLLIRFELIDLRDKLANAYYTAGRLTDAERVWKLVGNKEKLKTLSAAYRKAGDESNAARVFAEHWQ